MYARYQDEREWPGGWNYTVIGDCSYSRWSLVVFPMSGVGRLWLSPLCQALGTLWSTRGLNPTDGIFSKCKSLLALLCLKACPGFSVLWGWRLVLHSWAIRLPGLFLYAFPWLMPYTGGCHRWLLNPAQLLPDTFSLSPHPCPHPPAYAPLLYWAPVHSSDLSFLREAFCCLRYSLRDAPLAACFPTPSLLSIHFSLCDWPYLAQCVLGEWINEGNITWLLWIRKSDHADVSPSSRLSQFPQSNEKTPVQGAMDQSRQILVIPLTIPRR